MSMLWPKPRVFPAHLTHAKEESENEYDSTTNADGMLAALSKERGTAVHPGPLPEDISEPNAHMTTL